MVEEEQPGVVPPTLEEEGLELLVERPSVREELEELEVEPLIEEESEVVPLTVGKKVGWEMELPYEREEEGEREEEQGAE